MIPIEAVRRIALIGSGTIGASWAAWFLARGYDVTLYDPAPGAEAHSLSGGNLQKFIIGREMAVSPKILVAAHPTWGVDIGAAAVIHQALFDLCAAGAGVIVVSEDLDELFRIADRIAVIAHGRVSEPIARAAADREEIGLLMTAGRNAGEAGERSDAA